MATDRLYPPVDLFALGEHYIKHVEAMTAEGLHSKSDIAAQLAWRDQRIAQLERGEHAAVSQIDQALRVIEGATVEYQPSTVADCVAKALAERDAELSRLRGEVAAAKAEAIDNYEQGRRKGWRDAVEVVNRAMPGATETDLTRHAVRTIFVNLVHDIAAGPAQAAPTGGGNG